jgi:hypothetical protein
VNKNPHPHIFVYYDIVINITIESCKVLLCGYISLTYKLRLVAIGWEGVKRLRQDQGGISSNHYGIHSISRRISTCHRDDRWRRIRRIWGANRGYWN